HELEMKEDNFAQERDEFCKQKESMLKDIQELRLRTRGEQQARETEQNDHAMMLKEMQVLVAKERLAREQLENKIKHLEKEAHESRLIKSEDGSKANSA
ncbi:Hypothetical predicted protein, partial [Paramuricea clavata]